MTLSATNDFSCCEHGTTCNQLTWPATTKERKPQEPVKNLNYRLPAMTDRVVLSYFDNTVLLGYASHSADDEMHASIQEITRRATAVPPTSESLHDIIENHRAVCTASNDQIADLESQIIRWNLSLVYDPLADIVKDALAQLEKVRGYDALPGSRGGHEARWHERNPGLSALLKAVGHG